MAKGGSRFTLSVMDEHKVVYYGDCQILFVPGKRETLAILPHHTPMIMKLEPGEVRMKLEGSVTTLAEIKSGIVYVAADKVTVLANL